MAFIIGLWQACSELCLRENTEYLLPPLAAWHASSHAETAKYLADKEMPSISIKRVALIACNKLTWRITRSAVAVCLRGACGIVIAYNIKRNK